VSIMIRRNFIANLGVLAAVFPFSARAQQQMPVVGFLSGRSMRSDAHLVGAFRQALNDSGFIEGQNVRIEFRWAEGQLERLPELAAGLVRDQVTAMFAGGVEVHIRAIRNSTTTIPLVLATAGDPIDLGLVASFNRPSGNATVVTVISAALWPKRLELLREMIKPTTLIGLLVNPNNQTAESATRELRTAARSVGQNVMVLNARSEAEFDATFATLVHEKAGALIVSDDALFQNRLDRLVALAARHSIPAIYGRREYSNAGGLMSYGASTLDQYRQSGLYVGRILKGVKPAELPVLQPTKFELVINLKTAKALGLTVPLTLQVAADEVIE
jgi:putative tryptophan/tyrosine transport system substrate-binding protein